MNQQPRNGGDYEQGEECKQSCVKRADDRATFLRRLVRILRHWQSKGIKLKAVPFNGAGWRKPRTIPEAAKLLISCDDCSECRFGILCGIEFQLQQAVLSCSISAVAPPSHR
jgi:hypothetical protein